MTQALAQGLGTWIVFIMTLFIISCIVSFTVYRKG